MNKKKKKQNGFTIVELVIVIAVIGILAAILIPTFSNLVKKAQKSADQQLVYHINVAAAANEVDNGKAPTMYDTLQALENDYGFTIEKMTPRSGNDIVWDSTTNRFALVAKDNTVVYTDPNNPSKMANKAKMWRITEAGESLTDGYAHYLTAGWSGVVPTVSTGLDVGDNDDITSVTYARTGDAQDVVIRTNSANTTLSIFAPNDEVKHFDFCGKVNVKAAKDASYHEFGDVAFMEINKGHVVVETGASVDLMYSNPQAYKVENNEIVIDTTATVPAVTVSNNGKVDHAHAFSEASATATTSASQNVTFDYDGVNLSKDDTNHTTVNHAYGTYANDGVNSWTIETAAEQAVVEMKTKEAAKNAPTPEDPEIEYAAVNISKVATWGVNAYYLTFNEAYSAATAGDTICLLKDMNLDSALVLNKDVILDLNKCTINGEGGSPQKRIEVTSSCTIKNGNVKYNAVADYNCAIKVGSNASLIIDDLIVTSYIGETNAYCASVGIIGENASLTINGGIYYGSVQTVGSYTGNNVTINGGTFFDTYFPAAGNYEINGGTFNATNTSAFYFKSGSPIKINAGEFNVKLDSNYDGGKWAHYGNGAVGGNAAFVVESCNYGDHGISTINLTINKDIKFNVVRDGYTGTFYDVLIINYGYINETPNKVNCDGVHIDYAIVDKGDAVDANGQITMHEAKSKTSAPADGYLIFGDDNVTIIHPQD